jgi:hypothetical protein
VLKSRFVSSSLFTDDIILTTSTILLVSLIHKVVMAMIYKSADTNNDGFLTTREFYEWKHKLEEDRLEI